MAGSVQPEAILEWLQKEMGYQPLGSYFASSKAAMPPVDSVRKIFRGNMIPIWNFLLHRVKSEKTVEKIRRNILVHGKDDGNGNVGDSGRSKGRRKDRDSGSSSDNSREVALKERDLAVKEVEKLRQIVRRQQKELKARMLELSREEAERKQMLDERSSYRHKQVTLEAYDQQCDEAAKIFSEYHKRLSCHVNQARDVKKRSSVDSSTEVVTTFHANEKESILIETSWERNIRKACESLAILMAEKIRTSFPAYEGNGIHMNSLSQAAKLGGCIDIDGDMPDEVRDAIVNCLKNPPQLLQAITTYASKLKTTITREIEKVDGRADAEILRYKYENDRIMDASSPDVTSPLHYELYSNAKIGGDTSRGTQNQLLERQKAHVQQFMATEDALNKAAEARNVSQQLLKRLQGTSDAISSDSLVIGGISKNMSILRQLELEMRTKEREAAGLRASANTLMSEIQRLNKLCAERKEAEDSLRKKWKKIGEFDARRSELESIYSALLKASMDAAAFWSQQPLAAREYSSNTITPASTVVVDLSNSAKDLIEQEVSAFYQTPDNTLYMLPSTPQALLESMGVSGSTGPEAVAAAEKSATLLTARAGARDPSAIPSISRISAALQYPAGLDGSDAGLTAVLESMGFCIKHRGSEACILEDLEKAINLVHTRRDLVESGRALLDHAYKAQNEYERTTNYCLNVAAEYEKTATENWQHELDVAIDNAKHSLDEEIKYVQGLLNEWWEQPASTVVEWVTVDGQTVAAWLNDVKQLKAFRDQQRR